jgi:hypothetical protein
MRQPGPGRPGRRALVALGLSAVLGVVLAAQSASVGGNTLRTALLGVWCNSVDQGRSCWAYDVFMPDGRFRACGRNPDDGAYFEGSGTFEIVGQRMCYVVGQATDTFWVRPGSRFCTDITAIDARTHEYRDLESGERFVLYRHGAPVACAAVRPAGSP